MLERLPAEVLVEEDNAETLDPVGLGQLLTDEEPGGSLTGERDCWWEDL